MRIYLSSMAHPKRLAKRLAKSAALPLNRAQHCCAVMFGYLDWHELEQVTTAQLNPPSKPDYLVTSDIVVTRRRVLGSRLSYALARMGSLHWDSLWELMDELDPTGSMPDEAIFVDRRLDVLFPREWTLDLSDPDVAPDFDIDPDTGFVAQVGMSDSRAFEAMLRDACERAPQASLEWQPSDDHGYRTFSFDFADRKPFCDLRDSARSVVAIPFRFVPTIQENVLTALELVIHPAAFASSYLSGEHVKLLGEAMIEYFRASGLWACPDWSVCGSSAGIVLTLSGEIRSAPVLRIVDHLIDVLEAHAEMFSMDDEEPWEDKEYLPFRDVIVEYDNEVDDDELEADYAIQHRRSLFDELLQEVRALSRAPEMLARILTEKGFGQYAEFTQAMSVSSFDGWKNFSAFVCSMERINAISTDVSLYFRHHLADHVVAGDEPPPGSPEFAAYAEEADVAVAARYAAAARRLGDEALAKRYEVATEDVWERCFEASLDLSNLIEEFSEDGTR